MVKYVVMRTLGGKILESSYYEGKEHEVYSRLVTEKDIQECYERSHNVYDHIIETLGDDIKNKNIDVYNIYCPELFVPEKNHGSIM